MDQMKKGLLSQKSLDEIRKKVDDVIVEVKKYNENQNDSSRDISTRFSDIFNCLSKLLYHWFANKESYSRSFGIEISTLMRDLKDNCLLIEEQQQVVLKSAEKKNKLKIRILLPYGTYSIVDKHISLSIFDKKCEEVAKRKTVKIFDQKDGSFSFCDIPNVTKSGQNNGWEDLFFIKMKITIKMEDVEKNIDIHLISRPFSVITNSSQQVDARGAISWANYFGSWKPIPGESESQNKSFVEQHEATWDEVSDLLQKEFHHQTGHDLDDQHLEFLQNKFGAADSEDIVTRDSLLGNNISKKKKNSKSKESSAKFTLWKWFYATIHFIIKSPHIKEIWAEGLIYGYISKAKTEQILKSCQPGTVLLRFSESVITKNTPPTAFLSPSVYTDSLDVIHLDPFKPNELAVHSLGNLLISLKTNGERLNITKLFNFEGQHIQDLFSKFIIDEDCIEGYTRRDDVADDAPSSSFSPSVDASSRYSDYEPEIENSPRSNPVTENGHFNNQLSEVNEVQNLELPEDCDMEPIQDILQNNSNDPMLSSTVQTYQIVPPPDHAYGVSSDIEKFVSKDDDELLKAIDVNVFI